MRLGKRPSRIRAGGGGQLIGFRFTPLLAGLVLSAAASVPTAGAQPADNQTTSIGPARIVCNASFCQMGSGARPKERFRVIVSDLPVEEIHRLRKCTGVAKPCIVTIEGMEQGGPMKIIASGIHWDEEPVRADQGQSERGQH
jgi:hypothetical protein